jgi:hypothetical protein
MKYQCRSIRRDLQRMRFRVSNQNLHRRWRCQSGRAAAKGRRNFLNELVEFGGIEIADGPEIEAPADQCRTLYPWTVRFVTLACSAPMRHNIRSGPQATLRCMRSDLTADDGRQMFNHPLPCGT